MTTTTTEAALLAEVLTPHALRRYLAGRGEDEYPMWDPERCAVASYLGWATGRAWHCYGAVLCAGDPWSAMRGARYIHAADWVDRLHDAFLPDGPDAMPFERAPAGAVVAALDALLATGRADGASDGGGIDGR